MGSMCLVKQYTNVITHATSGISKLTIALKDQVQQNKHHKKFYRVKSLKLFFKVTEPHSFNIQIINNNGAMQCKCMSHFMFSHLAFFLTQF